MVLNKEALLPSPERGFTDSGETRELGSRHFVTFAKGLYLARRHDVEVTANRIVASRRSSIICELKAAVIASVHRYSNG
jgi:hypothetical protein